MACGILEEGRIRASVREALDRGVVFDVGHGAGSFSWGVVETALEQGVQPTSISSDLHVYNVDGPVYDLANVVNKFLHLGLSLDDCIAKVTSVPAGIVGMEGEIGTLRSGAWGDAVLFELREGEFRLDDAHGHSRTASRALEPVTVVKSGSIYRQRSLR